MSFAGGDVRRVMELGPVRNVRSISSFYCSVAGTLAANNPFAVSNTSKVKCITPHLPPFILFYSVKF